jgi:general secretion pathway protein G
MNRTPRSVPARTSASAAGFTLVEIMVVIVILGLLATLVVQNVVGASDEARIQTAKTNCATFAGAVKLYRTTKGKLPDSLEVLAGEEEKSKAWYIENLPKDPWDHDYELRQGNTMDDWEVISPGPDGLSGTEDDISNRVNKEN